MVVVAVDVSVVLFVIVAVGGGGRVVVVFVQIHITRGCHKPRCDQNFLWRTVNEQFSHWL